MTTMDPMVEVLLTVWAIGQEKGNVPPLSRLFPKRLQSALRRARKAGYVEVDQSGPYLDDAGSAYLIEHAPDAKI